MRSLNKKKRLNSSKPVVVAIMFLLVVSVVLAALPVAEAAAAITLSPSTVSPGGSVTVFGYGFGALKRVGIGLGAEVRVINETMPRYTGPWDVDIGPYVTHTAQVPIKPGSYVKCINISSTVWFQVDTDAGNGSFVSPSPMLLNGTIDYATGQIMFFRTAPLMWDTYNVDLVNYTTYEYDVTPPTRLTASKIGIFQTTITIPEVYNGEYTVTAIDTQGRVATTTLTVTGGEDPPQVWDWPMFRHNLTNAGYSESPAPSTNQTLWSTTVGIGGSTSATVVDGKLYVVSYDGNLYCLDAASGIELWSYSALNNIAGSPAVADGRVYCGGTGGYFYCNDAASGALLWNLSISSEDVSCSASVEDGKVYVGSDDGNVYCLDAVTGAKIWNYTTGDRVQSSPAVVDGKLYVGSRDGNVYCLDAVTGAKIWNYTTGDRVRSSPAVVDGKVYIGSFDNNVYCLNATSGAKIWNYTTGDQVRSSPAFAYGKVYVGSYDSNLYCLDAVTGAKIWNYTTGGRGFSSPAVADGKVYAAFLNNKTYCLDATNGAFIWSFTTGDHPAPLDDIWSSPTVANGVVYIYSTDTHVYAFGTEVIPEGLTLAVMLLLSTIAVIVSIRYYRKQPKWQNS